MYVVLGALAYFIGGLVILYFSGQAWLWPRIRH